MPLRCCTGEVDVKRGLVNNKRITLPEKSSLNKMAIILDELWSIKLNLLNAKKYRNYDLTMSDRYLIELSCEANRLRGRRDVIKAGRSLSWVSFVIHLNVNLLERQAMRIKIRKITILSDYEIDARFVSPDIISAINTQR